MTLLYFYNYVWSRQPEHRREYFAKDFDDLTPEELEEIKAAWQKYVTDTKAHRLEVHLLKEEWDYLEERAKRYGLTRSQLIEQFIKDFAGLRGNGSDEERLAEEWYDRNGSNYEIKEEEW